ncbi:MAG: alginate lyase family protein [Pseudomonadota bacterium]
MIGAGALLLFAGACSSTSFVAAPDAGTGGTASSTGGAGGGKSMGGAGGGATAGSAGGAMGGAGGAGGTVAFVHPGLLINAADIARIQAKIAAKSDPWLNNYNVLANNNLSSTARAWTTPPAIIGRNAASAYAADRTQCELDATAAYQTALLYAISGKTAYADYAVKVLNAYAAGVKHFDGVDPERDLEGAILGWLWVEAAELVRYGGTNYTGWAAADVAAFNNWIYDVVYSDQAYNAFGVLVTPIPNGAGARGAFALRTKMAIGIYLENATIYKEAVDYFFNGQGNGAPQYYILPSTGQTWEAGRDQNHAQGGLSRLIETAHMAHNQGNETLYAWGNDALSRAIEYIASYNLGNDVPYTPIQPFTTKDSAVYPTISATGRGTFATIYELPYHYWHDIRGLAMPYTLQAIMAEGTEQFSLQYDNPMFATLCFRQ